MAQSTQAIQSLEALTRAAKSFVAAGVETEYPEFQNKVSIQSPDSRLRLSPCQELRFSFGPGSGLYGSGTLGARCESPQTWELYLGYRVELTGPILVATRPISSRETVQSGDVQIRTLEISGPPRTYLNDPKQAVGFITRRPIKTGQPLDAAMLTRPLAIRSGQKVRIMVQTHGFTVSQECTAMANANVGDIARCKADNGQILQGTASETGAILVKP